MRIKDIESKSDKRCSIFSEVAYSNNSAQSPPCNKNASPLETAANSCFNLSIYSVVGVRTV